MRTIEQLVKENQKRVYVYLADKKTADRFIRDAEAEGYTFGDGVKISERNIDDFYAINRNHTVNFINGIGRMAFQCGAEYIVRIDYKKYVAGEDDYLYRRKSN